MNTRKTFEKVRIIGLLALMWLGGLDRVSAATYSMRPEPLFTAGNYKLLPTQRTISQNGQYWLTLQSAGNVVLYNFIQPLFATSTVGENATEFVFQADGNLVLYSNTTPLWASNTAGNPNSTLHLQDDGNLVIYSSSGTAIWSTGTSSFSTLLGNVSDIVNGALAKTKIVTPATISPACPQTLYPTSDIIISDYDAVADYAADCTGTTNSTNAIQNALNDCATNGGGTVWLQPGTYIVTSTITIPAFCTLRGNWQHLTGSPSGETIISFQVTGGSATGPAVFSVGGSAALMGVVIYYPYQDSTLTNVMPYGYAIEIPSGNLNQIASSIINVTLLNAYQGIVISPNPAQSHEVATVLNVEGTVLSIGLLSENSSDFDSYENVNFGPQFWSQAGKGFNQPNGSTLELYPTPCRRL